MAESREFAQAFTEQLDRTPKKKKIVEAQQDAEKIKVYVDGTMQFDEAVQKVSQGLLDVLYSQFGSKPQSFVEGGIVEETEEETTSTDSVVADEMFIDSFEEEDDD